MELLNKGIVSFSDNYEKFKRTLPSEYLNRGHGQPFFIPSREMEVIKKGESYSKAVEDLGHYKVRGGQLTRVKRKFVIRYLCCLVNYHLSESYADSLVSMNLWDRTNRERYIPSADSDPLCKHCFANHIPSADCEQLKSHGPINIKYLDRRLRGNVSADQVLYMGTAHTLYLHSETRSVVRNVGLIDYEQVYYAVREEEFEEDPPGHRVTLGESLMKRLPRNHGTLLVEFFHSSEHFRLHTINHLIGFMREIGEKQELYEGVIVLVLVPTPPVFSWSKERYIEHKRYFHRQVEVAKYLGEVFCIAVAPVLLQEVPLDDGHWAHHASHWNYEEIYGGRRKQQTLTREFQSRMYTELCRIRDVVEKVRTKFKF
jgi:hypothetical protein